MCLGYDLTAKVLQSPHGGDIPYDYIMWIDSDMAFRSGQIQRMLDVMESNKEIDMLSGMYLQDGLRNGKKVFAFQENWTPGVMPLNQFRAGWEDVQDRTTPFRADWAGMGFMMVRKGVYESIPTPWFQQVENKLPYGTMDLLSEDISFCMKAKEVGLSLYIDPMVVVGHEKLNTLFPCDCNR